MDEQPKLKSVNKYKPDFPLNRFPARFPIALGKEVIHILATQINPKIEGDTWEQIFARCIGASWRKSNVGLDDVVHNQTAWGAKTVYNAKPFSVKHVRLISGRNSVAYSYGIKDPFSVSVDLLGEKVLGIWNGRVTDIRKKFNTVRTVVLLKSTDLSELAVFESDADRFIPEDYYWQWNKDNNLEGYERGTKVHRFTWQPHGSQFTVIADVPKDKLKIRIRRPPVISRESVLEAIHFDSSWIEIVK